MTDQIATVDVDEAYTVSAGDDTVYFDVAEGEDGWHVSAIIDCDSASFVDSLVNDDGPYMTEEQALQAGLNSAIEWMLNNSHYDYEIDPQLEDLRQDGRK